MMATVEAKPSPLTIHKRVGQVCSVALLAATVGLISCHGKLDRWERGVIDTPIVCRNFQPITWVNSDSELTRAQINAHNVTWNEYCRGLVTED